MNRRCCIFILFLAGCAARPDCPSTTVDESVPAAFRSAEGAAAESQPEGNNDDFYFDLIDQCPRPGSADDPIRLVLTVNTLQPLGTKEALRVLRAYVAKTQPDKAARRVDYPSRVFWVARLLFVDADGGSVRCPAIGHFGVMIDEDSTSWPLYPLAVIAGVPFEVADGISLNGRAERPESYLDEIEGSVVVRRHFMRPADNPLEAANQLFKSDAWKDARWSGDETGHKWALSEDRMVQKVRSQAIEALRNVYDPGEEDYAKGRNVGAYGWDMHLIRSRELRPYWDEKAQEYLARS